jgi:glycosyltransferase involved in cell wall biosynthesis
MKHIVILGKYYPPEFGGMERYTSDLARIAAKSDRVTVVVHNRERHDQIEHDQNITIIRCGTAKTVSSQPLSLSILRHLRSLRPDLVHFNAPNFWSAAMLLLASQKVPLLITHHADVVGRPILKRAVMPIYRHLARRASYVIVNSLRNARASKDLPIEDCRFVEIPWAVDERDYRVDDLEPVDLMAERQRRFGDAAVIGFLGRFVRYKGLPVLVEALARLDGVHAVLIGDGPLRAQIEEQASIAGIFDRIHFLGNLDERAKIRELAMMDILAFPSNDTTEAFGVVQVEAQMMGLPVVASNLPTGVIDVTLDEITGLLVPPNDPDALANALSRLIRDPALARRFGATGRERALRLFSMSVFEERVSRLYRAALSGELEEIHSPCLQSPAAS